MAARSPRVGDRCFLMANSHVGARLPRRQRRDLRQRRGAWRPCHDRRPRVHRRQHRRASVRPGRRGRDARRHERHHPRRHPVRICVRSQGRSGRAQRGRPQAARNSPRRHASPPPRLSACCSSGTARSPQRVERAAARIRRRSGGRQDRLVHSRRRLAAADDARGGRSRFGGCRTRRHERAAAERTRTSGPRSPSSAAAAACRLRWPTPPCAAAAASCCLRSADGPTRSASPPIRTTGSWMGQFGRFHADRARRRAAAMSSSSARSTRPSLWQMRPDWRALRLMPQIVRLYRGGDDHLQSGIGRMFEQHGFRLLGPHDIAPELAHAARAARRPRADRARPRRHRARACAAATPPARSTSARPWSWPTIRCSRSKGRRAPTRRWRASPNCAATAAFARRPASAFWSRPPSSARTIASICRRSGRRPSRARRAAGLAGIAVVAGTTIVAEPERIAAAADRAEIFVVGVDADGTAPMTSAGQPPPADRVPARWRFSWSRSRSPATGSAPR